MKSFIMVLLALCVLHGCGTSDNKKAPAEPVSPKKPPLPLKKAEASGKTAENKSSAHETTAEKQKYQGFFCRTGINEPVYYIENNRKRRVPDVFTLRAMDGYEEKIIQISEEKLNSFSAGDPIPTIVNTRVKNNFLQLFDKTLLKKKEHIEHDRIVPNELYFQVDKDTLEKFSGKYVLEAKKTFKYEDILKVSESFLDLFVLKHEYTEKNIKNNGVLQRFSKVFEGQTLYHKSAVRTGRPDKIFQLSSGKLNNVTDWAAAEANNAEEPLVFPETLDKVFVPGDTIEVFGSKQTNEGFFSMYEGTYIKSTDNENVYQIKSQKRIFVGTFLELSDDIKKQVNTVNRDILQIFPESK